MSHLGSRRLFRTAAFVSALCWLCIASSCYKNDRNVNELCAAIAWGDTERVQTLLKEAGNVTILFPESKAIWLGAYRVRGSWCFCGIRPSP